MLTQQTKSQVVACIEHEGLWFETLLLLHPIDPELDEYHLRERATGYGLTTAFGLSQPWYLKPSVGEVKAFLARVPAEDLQLLRSGIDPEVAWVYREILESERDADVVSPDDEAEALIEQEASLFFIDEDPDPAYCRHYDDDDYPHAA